MAMTPEGKIKKKVSAYLRSIDGLWYTMPVPGGYGMSTLDYIGCINGKFFAIETKAPGNKPTPRQQRLIDDINLAGGTAFVVDDELFPHLRHWVQTQRSGL